MSKSLFFTVIGFLITLSPFVRAQMRSIAAENFYLCKNQKQVRSLHVQQSAEGCLAIYTKQGEPLNIGKGKNRASCLPLIKNVLGNLEKAGWKCKSSQDATIVTPATNSHENE